MNEAKEHIDELKELATDYLESRVELIKIEATEKVSRIIGVFLTLMIFIVIFFLVLVALSIVAGAFLNSVLQSVYGGYLIVAGIYLIAFAVLVLRRKRMEEFFMSKIIQAIYQKAETHEAGN